MMMLNGDDLRNKIVSWFDDDDLVVRHGVVQFQYEDVLDYEVPTWCVLIKTTSDGDWVVPVECLFDENDEVETFEKSYKWYSDD